jgi:multiple sugar transport system ATP-binding protein
VGKKSLDKHPGLENMTGSELVIGIRPSDLEAAAVAGRDPERSMNVTIEVTEMLGADTYIHFTVDRSPVVTPDIEELLADTGQDAESLGDKTNFVARVSPDVSVNHGDSLELTIDGDKLLFFDPATGDRVGVKKLTAAAT